MFINKKDYKKLRPRYTMLDVDSGTSDYNEYSYINLGHDRYAFLIYNKSCDYGVVLVDDSIKELFYLEYGSSIGVLKSNKNVNVFLKSPLDLIVSSLDDTKSIIIPIRVLFDLYNRIICYLLK